MVKPIFNNDAIVLGLLVTILAFVFTTARSENKFWKKFYTYIPALLLCNSANDRHRLRVARYNEGGFNRVTRKVDPPAWELVDGARPSDGLNNDNNQQQQQ